MAIFTGAGVAIITPFHADGSINYEKLEEVIMPKSIQQIDNEAFKNCPNIDVANLSKDQTSCGKTLVNVFSCRFGSVVLGLWRLSYDGEREGI